ncbi:MAG: DNA repair protein RecN [Clostridia bacterium]|nr:DNA repair protein RecN [Clostridia bacterium]
MRRTLLCELRVRRFAIIAEARVTFGPGFNVLTGETGTGKSILVDALAMALGERATAEVIASGDEEAEVAAVFELGEEPALLELLAREGFADEGEGLVVLGRTISRSGRHLAHVNGRVATARLLREIGRLVVEVHGQHEHQQLLSPSSQRRLLDRYAGEAGRDWLAQVREAYDAWREIQAERESLLGDPRERARREDLLRFQVKEIDAARLAPGDLERMAARREVLQHAQRLFEVAALGYQRLAEGGGGARAILDGLAEIAAGVAQAAEIDEALAPTAGLLSQALVELREAAHELRAYRDGVRFDPRELAEIEERWDLVHRLLRKYGDSIEDVLRYRDEAAATLERWERARERAEVLDVEERKAREKLSLACLGLRRAREEAARRLSREVSEELRQLGFPEAAFQVTVQPRLAPEGVRVGAQTCAVDATGADDVEFWLAPNPGERARPVRQAASGGELSRVMLGVRASFAGGDDVPVLVFDEIDSGIGGATAQAVGERLSRLGRDRQVLCVTHLPQIAARADHHVAIRKRQSARRTTVEVRSLDRAGRQREIARMLSGVETPASLAHARQLIDGGARRDRL